MHLSWTVDIATDPAALVAALYAQSSQTLLGGQLGQASESDLVAPGGTAALWAISGTFYIQEKAWEIPIGQKGELILPDITKLHMVVAVERPWTNTGDVEVELLRTNGQLMRLFTSGYSADNVPLSALPGTADANKIDKFKVRYGMKNTPIDYDPASVLAGINAKNYRGPVPYDRLVVDNMLYNPARDMWLLQGVTNLRADVYVDSAVAPTVGEASVRVVEELLV